MWHLRAKQHNNFEGVKTNQQSHKTRNPLLHTMGQQSKPSLPATDNFSPTCLRPFGNFFLFPRCWQRLRSFSRSELYWWWWSLFFFGRYDSPLVSASRFFLARGFCRFSTRSWGFRATSFCRGREQGKEEKKNTVIKIWLRTFSQQLKAAISRWLSKHFQGNETNTRKRKKVFAGAQVIKR